MLLTFIYQQILMVHMCGLMLDVVEILINVVVMVNPGLTNNKLLYWSKIFFMA